MEEWLTSAAEKLADHPLLVGAPLGLLAVLGQLRAVHRRSVKLHLEVDELQDNEKSDSSSSTHQRAE